MFGRKIPDKVMAPLGPPAVTEQPRVEKKPVSDRPQAPPTRTESVLRRPNSGGVETVIGEDTTILAGKLISKGTLRIDGRVEGEVQAEEAVVVGPSGTVKANIVARSVAVSGKVWGNVVAHERLEIQPTGEVHGDVQTSAGALMVEAGAKLEGRCIMGLDEKAMAAAVAQAANMRRPAPEAVRPDAAAQQQRKPEPQPVQQGQ